MQPKYLLVRKDGSKTIVCTDAGSVAIAMWSLISIDEWLVIRDGNRLLNFDALLKDCPDKPLDLRMVEEFLDYMENH